VNADHAASPVPAMTQALLDGLVEAVCVVDARHLGVVAANAAAARLLGLDRTALLGRAITELCVTPEDLAYWGEVVTSSGAIAPLESESYVVRSDGRAWPVMRRIRALDDDPGRFLVTLLDRSAALREQEQRDVLVAELQATLESTADGVRVTDLAGRTRAFNRRFAVLWDLPEGLLERRDDEAIERWMREQVRYTDDPANTLEIGAPAVPGGEVLHLASGRVLERVVLPQVSRGEVVGRVESFRDLTMQRAAQARIERLSRTDELTGTVQRHVLAERLDWALAMARRDGTAFALLVLDLDRFAQINESLGDAVGDHVLTETADRVRRHLREVDTFARLGADAFAVLLHGADAAGADAVARRLMAAVARPFDVQGTRFTVTCSVGVALHPKDGDQADALLHTATRAMRRAKSAGSGTLRFADPPEHDRDPRSRMQLDHAMRQALARSEFRLHYQPQVDLASGRVIGAEALLRWRDRELGDVPPGRFIPVAEETGYIVAIGEWVLREALHQAAAWHRRGWPLPVAVNVSALQFQQPDFVERVAQALHHAGLPAHLLELELTESILVRDADAALRRLQALAALGVAMAIDDFGTGYSSLGYLKRLPIARLKIDRGFVQGLPGDESDAGIVAAVVHMARALGLAVIAEGVETEAQRQHLADLGCHAYQGFLCAPALDARTFESRFGPQAQLARKRAASRTRLALVAR
jgi:diguanylate cyclase (GGDEF)-like protein